MRTSRDRQYLRPAGAKRCEALFAHGARLAWLFAGLFAPSGAVIAQGYPERPVRIIVPLVAGGNQDIVTRSIAQKLSEQTGQQFIVENRPSASGIVGANYVAKAPADGYTFLSIANTFVAAPATVLGVGYDPVKDFAGVSLLAVLPQLFLVHPSSPVNGVRDLIALAKRRPDELTFGSAGRGSVAHMGIELFNARTGIRMIHIPYKGNAPALTDLIGGQIVFLADPISTALPYVRTGKAKALAVTSARRSPILPDLPTVSESGVQDYEVIVYNAILAPAATPRAILGRVHAEIVKAVQQPELLERFLRQGVELRSSASPEENSSFIRTEAERYAKIARDAGLKPE